MKSTTIKSKATKLSKNGPQKLVTRNVQKTKLDVARGLRDLFVDELKDIYWAEKALTKAIPKMIKNATSSDLVDALSGHLEITKEQVTRLEKIFYTIGEKAVDKKCEAMTGLIKEAEKIMKETEKGVVRDAGIILAGQKVEHYEIATYGTLSSFAKTLGEHEAASLLEETLNEEKEADEKLSEIAESSINIKAASENDEGSDQKIEVNEKHKELSTVYS